MTFKDHFSTQAATYAAARPRYPDGLFAYLADASPARDAVLDVATGNGQAALSLAKHFRQVTGIDGSQNQIDNATPAENVHYECAKADALPLPDESVDLVTVAQALHWFPLEEFYAEARRVLRPKGLIAAITYNTPRFDSPDINDAVDILYEDILGPYWPPERRHVEAGYTDLPFPFDPITVPDFEMTTQWSLEMLTEYVNSWSATNIYKRETGIDPVPDAMPKIKEVWGSPDRIRLVRFPLSVIAGRA
ncbi:MAG: class I SAM-dependent methyltransferase [Alphaproteobacteria bacterium]|nr:class I SAM-dependent methyltransferase [Alphaproteobacteria bacterium SS10]